MRTGRIDMAHGHRGMPAGRIPQSRHSLLAIGPLRLAVAELFALTLALSIYLVKFCVAGLPFRAFTACLILLLSTVTVPSLVFEVLKAARPILLVIAFAAMGGLFPIF